MKHGVTVVLIRKEDRAVLMQHRDDKPGIPYRNTWICPSGGVEETDEDDFAKAATRELKEETNYCADKLFHLVDKELSMDVGGNVMQHFFLAIYDGEQKIEYRGEGQGIQFLSIDNLKGKKIVPGQIELLESAFEKAEELGLITKELRGEIKIK